MSDDQDQTPAPTSPDPQHSVSSSTSGMPGDNTMNGAGTSEGGLEGTYLKNPESTVDRVYKKDKDPDERALGSDEGHRSQMPDYQQLMREDETERPGRG